MRKSAVANKSAVAGAELETQLTLERACDGAYDDVCRQLAFHSAGDKFTFDVVVLAYSLLTYVLVLDLHEDGDLLRGQLGVLLVHLKQ